MIEGYITYFQKEPIACIPVFLNLVPIILLVRRKAYIEKTFFLLLIYLVIKLVIDLTMFDFASNRKNTMLLYNINVPVRFALLSYMYSINIESIRIERLILASVPVVILASVWEVIALNPNLSDLHNHKMIFLSTTIESLLMLLWALLYFYDAIRALRIPNLLSYPFFWISSGFLIYYSTLLFIAPVLHFEAEWENWIEIGILFYLPYIFESICLILVSIGAYHYHTEIDAKH